MVHHHFASHFHDAAQVGYVPEGQIAEPGNYGETEDKFYTRLRKQGCWDLTM